LLLSQGLDQESAASLLDAILDWRDPDELVRPQGAERDQYEAAGYDYLPANAPFQSVDELRLVIGMTPDLMRRLQPLLTVYSLQSGINSRQAPRAVLLALPNVQAEDVEAYLGLREEAYTQLQMPTPFPQAAAYEASGNTQVYNLRSVVSLSDGARFASEAVVKLINQPDRPYVVMRWQEVAISADDFRQTPDNLDATQP
jgi:general secretion pathway protein K